MIAGSTGCNVKVACELWGLVVGVRFSPLRSFPEKENLMCIRAVRSFFQLKRELREVKESYDSESSTLNLIHIKDLAHFLGSVMARLLR